MIMGFLPRDVIEVLFAGHCVMLHEVMTANVHDTLRGETGQVRRGSRSNLVALNKAFNDNLERLERYRLRPAEGTRDSPEVPPAEAPTPPDNVEPPPKPAGEHPDCRAGEVNPVAKVLNRAARRQAARAQLRETATPCRTTPKLRVAGRTVPDPLSAPLPEALAAYQPSAQAIAACQANPEAMAALAAGDPDRFARVLGIDTPGDAFLAAAKSPGSPFDPRATGPWPAGVVASPRKA
jgi:hypothetical protein